MRFLLLIIFLTSCASGSTGYKNSRNFSHLEDRRVIKETSHKQTAPTELMQVGYKKKKRYSLSSNSSNYSTRSYSSNPKKDEYIKQAKQNHLKEQDLEDAFINADGSYKGNYKVGNEYEIFGVKYQPQKYEEYEEVGTSSWYGDAFHGKKTANGEIYHKGDMTAAHPTLPLPSMVKITNLENGKSVKLRVNDRGPFAKNRIIDVSQTAAEMLGYKDKGTATVKLEFLVDETEAMLRKLGLK